MHLKPVVLVLLLLSLRTTAHAVPAPIMSDAANPHVLSVNTTVESMPRALREALRRTFHQKKLAIANPTEAVRETDSVFSAAEADVPTRRLILAFRTERLYYVYYRTTGYENGCSLLAFSLRGKSYQLFWGGVEFKDDPRTPNEVFDRLKNGSFDDSKKFFW